MRDLAPDAYREVNGNYYRAEPADYFEQRWLSVVLAAGFPSEREELLRRGVNVNGLQFSRDESDVADEKRWKRSIDHFVIAEVEQLSHHIGETLLRLYMAHKNDPPCPAIELSRVLGPGTFKRAVRARFRDSRPSAPARRREIGKVFYGSPTRKPYASSVPADAWTRALDTLDEYLTYFAGRFLDGAPLYNAAKHGLALTLGESKMELKSTPIRAAGPAISYLSEVTDERGSPRLGVTTHWVRIGRELAFAWIGKEMIRSVWSMARYRYTAKPEDRLQVQLFNYGSVSQIMATEPNELVEITDMTVGLSYWEPLSPDESASLPPVS